jgi:cytochrome b
MATDEPKKSEVPAAQIDSTAMKTFFRYMLLGYAWLFLAAIVVQVYFAGLMLFGQEGGKALHVGTGYTLSIAGLLFLALPALGRAGARTVILGVVLAVITFFQPTITQAREESPVIAALHPVNALLIVALSVVMIVRATQLVREQRALPGRPV